jgi:hypothetical protein
VPSALRISFQLEADDLERSLAAITAVLAEMP